MVWDSDGDPRPPAEGGFKFVGPFDIRGIITSLEIVGIIDPGKVLTKEEIFAAVDKLNGSECKIDHGHLKIVLRGSKIFKKVKGGWTLR
jgi:hypothetical protein